MPRDTTLSGQGEDVIVLLTFGVGRRPTEPQPPTIILILDTSESITPGFFGQIILTNGIDGDVGERG